MREHIPVRARLATTEERARLWPLLTDFNSAYLGYAKKTSRLIPVVILSKSSAERDVQETYNLHANCFVQKPLDLDDFIAAVRRIEDFWISFVRLPAA